MKTRNDLNAAAALIIDQKHCANRDTQITAMQTPAMNGYRNRCLKLLVLLIVLASTVEAKDRPYISVYGGPYSPNRLVEIVSADPFSLSDEAHITVLAVGQPIGFAWRLSWGVESQFARHWGAQQHFEFNALWVGRRHLVHWSRYIDAALALGQGLSYATAPPPLEPRANARDVESSKLLNYLMLELEAAPPSARHWSGTLRIHHRSGVFGTFSGIQGGSNFVTTGLRYRF